MSIVSEFITNKPKQRATPAPLNYSKPDTVSKKFTIVELPTMRMGVNIDDYILAVERAKYPEEWADRSNLYKAYDECLTYDFKVESLLEKRLENLSNKELVAYRGEEIAEDVNDFTTAPKFTDFIKDILLYGKFWGIGLFDFLTEEKGDEELFSYKTLPVRNLNPKRKEVLERPSDKTGMSWEDRNDVLFIGDENNLGLLLKITLLSQYKRWAMVNYSKYMDLASQNFNILKMTAMGDEEATQAVQNEINSKGAGGSLSLPDGINYESQNQSSSQQNTLFENFLETINDEMAILILGQTMTTEDGSSRSQAEVHLLEQEEKYTSDEAYVLEFLNYEFKEYLELWDINSAGVEWRFEEKEITKLNKKLHNFKQLKELGLEFSSEELREHFSEMIK